MSGFFICGFAAMSASTLTPCAAAICERVSPRSMVCVELALVIELLDGAVLNAEMAFIAFMESAFRE